MSAPASTQTRYDPTRFQRNIRVYYLFMGSTGFMLFLPIWIIYLINGRGLSLTEVGVFESFFWLTIIIAEVPTGAIADRFGRKVSLALGAVLFAVSTLIFAQAENFLILLGSYVVLGVAMTLYSGASEALLYDTLRVLGRTSEYEHHSRRSHALFWMVLVVATAIGGPLAYLLGYSLAISFSAIFFLIAAVAALLLREPPRREADFPVDPLHAPPAGRQHTARAEQTTASGVPLFDEVLNGFRLVWSIRPVRYLIPFAALMLAVFEMPRFLTQPYVAQHGIDPLASAGEGLIWSALLIPSELGTVVGMVAAAWLVGRFGPRRTFPMILLFGAVFMIPLAIWNHLGLLGTIFMVSIAHAAIRPIATGYINRRITSDQRATVLSIFALVTGGAMSVILLTIVPAADIYSFPVAFGMALGVVATLGAGLWLIWRRAHLRDQADQMRRWSMTIPKPQALQQATEASRQQLNGDRNGHERADVVYPNVQNLD